MRLTVGQLFGAMQALDAVLRARRPMPQIGKFRLARMHSRLLPDFLVANAQREELITKHGTRREDGQTEVLPDDMAAFGADWQPIADAEVEVDVEPVRLVDVTLDGSNGGIEGAELVLLGDLVTE